MKVIDYIQANTSSAALASPVGCGAGIVFALDIGHPTGPIDTGGVGSAGVCCAEGSGVF